jgi:membrane-associated phospholipid phosphatase
MTRVACCLLLALGCLARAQTPALEPLPSPHPAEKAEPGLKEFPRELARNFRALISTQNLAPLAVGVALTAAAKIPNGRVESFFGAKPESRFGEPGEYIGSAWLAGPTVAGLLLAGRKSGDARFRSFTYSLAQGYVINQSIAGGIKKAVRSQRPNGENSLSFPSGHTSSAFAWAATVSHHYGFKAGLPAYLAAAYVGFSRLDEQAHRLTDVVAGAALGYIVGKTVSRRANPDRRLDWNVVVPPGGGVGLSLAVHLPRLGLTQKQLLIESRTSIISECLAGGCARRSDQRQKP